jgi:hypothetical protein
VKKEEDPRAAVIEPYSRARSQIRRNQAKSQKQKKNEFGMKGSV